MTYMNEHPVTEKVCIYFAFFRQRLFERIHHLATIPQLLRFADMTEARWDADIEAQRAIGRASRSCSPAGGQSRGPTREFRRRRRLDVARDTKIHFTGGNALMRGIVRRQAECRLAAD